MDNERTEKEVKNLSKIFLRSSQRLALAIIGKLAVRHHLDALVVNEQDGSLTDIYATLTEAIEETLPDLDKVEIERMMEGGS